MLKSTLELEQIKSLAQSHLLLILPCRLRFFVVGTHVIASGQRCSKFCLMDSHQNNQSKSIMVKA
jgi:collagenase-like PrtC family protease